MTGPDPRNPGDARHVAIIMDGNGRWAEARPGCSDNELMCHFSERTADKRRRFLKLRTPVHTSVVHAGSDRGSFRVAFVLAERNWITAQAIICRQRADFGPKTTRHRCVVTCSDSNRTVNALSGAAQIITGSLQSFRDPGFGKFQIGSRVV